MGNIGIVTCQENIGRCPGRSPTDCYEELIASVETRRSPFLEELMLKLFQLQDLKGDGMLEEEELMKLNEKIAMLHKGKDVDLEVVRKKYSNLFRSKLDPHGRAVPFCKFHVYMLGVLDELDTDQAAQEMILEQFIAEAQVARRLFYQGSFASDTDWPFMPKLSQGSWDALDAHENSKLERALPHLLTHSAALVAAPKTPKASTTRAEAIARAVPALGRSDPLVECGDEFEGMVAHSAPLLPPDARRRSSTIGGPSQAHGESEDSVQASLRPRGLTASGVSPVQGANSESESPRPGSRFGYMPLRSWTSTSGSSWAMHAA